MNVSEIYNKLALMSPRMEVVLRKIYWNNYKFLNRFKPKSSLKPPTTVKINFDKIIEYLRSQGVGEGALLILHSSFGAIKGSGLSPDKIIDELLELIGTTGTLAMPVIRNFSTQENDILADYIDEECVYDVQSTPITTGVLPIRLHVRKESVTSRFPLNPMCAIGPLAKEMMADNLNGNSPHDEHSAWKYCADHNAIIVGIGIDLALYMDVVVTITRYFSIWS